MLSFADKPRVLPRRDTPEPRRGHAEGRPCRANQLRYLNVCESCRSTPPFWSSGY